MRRHTHALLFAAVLLLGMASVAPGQNTFELADCFLAEPGSPSASEYLEGKSSDEAVAELVPLLRHGDPAVRYAAAVTLADYPHPAAAIPLLRHTLGEPEKELRQACVKTLLGMVGPDLYKSFLPYLRYDSPYIRTRAAEALGQIGSPCAVNALIRVWELRSVTGGGPRVHDYFAGQRSYIRDYDVEVATGVTAFDPIIGVLQEGVVLDTRVLRVETITTAVELLEGPYYEGALKQILLEEIRGGWRGWQSWWDGNKTRVLAEYRERRKQQKDIRAAKRSVVKGLLAEDQGSWVEAWDTYERIEKQYPTTEWARWAEERRALLLEREESAVPILETKAEREAKSLLSLAKTCLTNGLAEQARQHAEAVLREYPQTSHAEEARKLLEEIPRK